jgi:putative nucleotidyltransferase with HDIG domain/PAS domain S-box-containing protein
MADTAKHLDLLVVEDVPDDAELLVLTIRGGGYDVEYEVVATADEMSEALSRRDWQIVISDYRLPGFGGLEALRLLRERDADTPFILYSGVITEEDAVRALRAGAADFVSKQRMARLLPAIDRELRDAEDRGRKREAERQLLLEEQARARLVSIIDATPDLVSTADVDGNVLYMNPGGRAMLGIGTGEDLSNYRILDAYPERAAKLVADEGIPAAMRDGVWGGETVLLSRDGREIPVSQVIVAHKGPDGTVEYLSTIMRDMTARKRRESELSRVNNALRMLSRSNEALVRATEERALLENVCRILIEDGENRAAWIASMDDGGLGLGFRVGASRTDPDGAALRSLVEPHMRREPVAAAFETGTPLVVRMPATPEIARVLGIPAEDERMVAMIGFPLVADTGPLGMLSVITDEPDAFDEPERDLLAEMAADLGYGIAALRMREKQQSAVRELAESYRATDKALRGTIHAMERMVETRDPYTAGHQERVARLAVAIATELGLSDEDVGVIDLAAAIHDVGKMQIPAEILSKPGALSAAELQMVHEHATHGYELVREIEFPWPIADIILQHHERMDGSGYPDGLRGADIVLGARIIGVADVIEAMSSHRPYRPALGVDAAMEFVREGRGVQFDTEVVDACLALLMRNPRLLSAPLDEAAGARRYA